MFVLEYICQHKILTTGKNSKVFCKVLRNTFKDKLFNPLWGYLV